MSSGIAAPIPQFPRTGHDFLDPDSWPARQLETCLARLQSVQAALKGISYEGGKIAQTGSTPDVIPQVKRTAGTYPRPTKVATGSVSTYEADVDAALAAVTTAVVSIREALFL